MKPAASHPYKTCFLCVHVLYMHVLEHPARKHRYILYVMYTCLYLHTLRNPALDRPCKLLPQVYHLSAAGVGLMLLQE